MKPSLLIVFLIVLVLAASDTLAVFPSRQVYEADGTQLPYGQFIERPRMIDGERYMPQATETIVVILVEFPADNSDNDSTALEDTCAAVGFQSGHDSTYYTQRIFSENAGSNSMDKYWDECSLGNMDIAGTVFGPYTMPHGIKYYGWDSDSCLTGTVIDDGWSDDAGRTDCQTCPGGVGTGTCRLIQDAVNAADADINYCVFDTDGDTSVDHVMVVHAGKGQEVGGVPTWNIWSWFYGNLNFGPYDAANCGPGVSVTSGFIVPEFYADPDSFPLGVFCHEFSHSIGNPDLYDPQSGVANVPDMDDYPVADWCLMAHGSWSGPTGTAERPSHLLGFNKIGTGWVTPTVLKPQKDTTSYTVNELEVAGASVYQIDISRNEYFLVENRHSKNQNIDFDKYDSDWSDWTGHGGPRSMDCGLIITHVMAVHDISLMNSGLCGYDYQKDDDSCDCVAYPWEVWVEDPGYNDSLTTDWAEWYYPWEIKAGAALATDDPHAVFDTLWYYNDNCTRTATSIDNSGKVTGIYVKPTSACGSAMNADVFIPGWTPPEWKLVAGPPIFCSEWSMLHHDKYSNGWTFLGIKPDVRRAYSNRLSLRWTAPGATVLRSSPVVTNTEVDLGGGDVVQGLVIVAASDDSVHCYGIEDGRRLWARQLIGGMTSTPIACDTLYARDGSYLELNKVLVPASMMRLYWLNLGNGALQGFWQEPYAQPVEAAPRIAMVEDPGAPGSFMPMIFLGAMSGNMYAINAQTRLGEWEYPSGAPVNCPAALSSIELPSMATVLAGNRMPQQVPRIDVAYFGNAAGDLHCVGAFDGAPVWSLNLGIEILASPAVCDSVYQAVAGYSDQMVVAATMDGHVYALDAANGNMLWLYDTGSAIVSSPSVAVDRVHNWGMVWLQTTGGTVYCLHLGDPPGGNRVIWTYTGPDGGTGSSPGVVLPYGMLPLGFNEMGRPVFPPDCATGDPESDGVVYVGTGGGGGGGRIVALDAADGSLLWHDDMPVPVEASPAPTLGMMFVTADQLYAFGSDSLASVTIADQTDACPLLSVGPNPMSPSTAIEYGVARKAMVWVKIYDIQGKLVTPLFTGVRNAGRYRIEWDGRNGLGEDVAGGVYFVRLDTRDEHISKKIVLVR